MKDLLSSFKESLLKHNLHFTLGKEYQTKYKGFISGKDTKIQIPFEISKDTQINRIDTFTKMALDSYNMCAYWKEVDSHKK